MFFLCKSIEVNFCAAYMTANTWTFVVAGGNEIAWKLPKPRLRSSGEIIVLQISSRLTTFISLDPRTYRSQFVVPTSFSQWFRFWQKPRISGDSTSQERNVTSRHSLTGFVRRQFAASSHRRNFELRHGICAPKISTKVKLFSPTHVCHVSHVNVPLIIC